MFCRIITNEKNENPYLLLDEINTSQIHKIRTKSLQ